MLSASFNEEATLACSGGQGRGIMGILREAPQGMASGDGVDTVAPGPAQPDPAAEHGPSQLHSFGE